MVEILCTLQLFLLSSVSRDFANGYEELSTKIIKSSSFVISSFVYFVEYCDKVYANIYI